MKTLKQRIEDRCLKDSITGCWIWTGSTTSMDTKLSYGKITTGSKLNGTRRNQLVHRVAYEQFIGPIPNGKLVLHKCDNPICVNPDHMYLGTYGDNVRDMLERGRQRKTKKILP